MLGAEPLVDFSVTTTQLFVPFEPSLRGSMSVRVLLD